MSETDEKKQLVEKQGAQWNLIYGMILLFFIIFLVILMILEWRKRFHNNTPTTGPTSHTRIDTGPTGHEGHRGRAGATGQQGLTGPPGITGATGYPIPIDATGALTDTLIGIIESENIMYGIGVTIDARADFGVPTGLLGPQTNHLDVYLPSSQLWYDYGPWLGDTGDRGILGFKGPPGPQETGPTGPSAPTGPTGPTGSSPTGHRGPTGHAGPAASEWDFFDTLNVSQFSKWSPGTDGTLSVRHNKTYAIDKSSLLLDHLYVEAGSTLKLQCADPFPVMRIFVSGQCVIEGTVEIRHMLMNNNLDYNKTVIAKCKDNVQRHDIDFATFISMLQYPTHLTGLNELFAAYREDLLQVEDVSMNAEHGGLLVLSAPRIEGSGFISATSGTKTGDGGVVLLHTNHVSKTLEFDILSRAGPTHGFSDGRVLFSPS